MDKTESKIWPSVKIKLTNKEYIDQSSTIEKQIKEVEEPKTVIELPHYPEQAHTFFLGKTEYLDESVSDHNTTQR